MKRAAFSLLILTSLTLSAPLAAQDFTEKDPDMVLPPMFFEIEDRTKENVKTALPTDEKFQEIALPELSTPMPDPTEKGFQTEQIDTFLTQISHQGGLKSSTVTTKSPIPVRFEGTAGLGTIGQVDLGFRLFGNTPFSQFGFSATHQSRDGFSFRPWGGEFYDRHDHFTGSHSFQKKIFSNDFQATLTSRGFGTQQLSTKHHGWEDIYFTFKERFGLSVETLRWEAIVDFDLGHRFQEDVKKGQLELFVNPRTALEIRLPQTRLRLEGGYGWVGSFFEKKHGHSADILFEFDRELPKAVNLGGGLGLFWESNSHESAYGVNLKGFSIPFYLQLYGSGGDFFRYKIKGGFENQRQSYVQLSRQYRYLAPEILPSLSGWFAQGEFDFRIKQWGLISLGIDFQRKSGTVLIDEQKTNAAALIPFTVGVKNLLYGSVKGEFTPIKDLKLSVGWEGSLLPFSQYFLKPFQQLEAALTYTIAQKWFTFHTDLLFEHYQRSYIPQWNLEGRFVLDNHFSLVLGLEDLLAPIYKEGRPSIWGQYLQSGLGASLLLEIKY